MSKSKELDILDIEVVKKEMEEQGYSPDMSDLWSKGAKDIQPGQEYPEYTNLIYIAVMPDDSSSIAGANLLQRDNTQDVIDGHNGIIDALKKSLLLEKSKR